MNHSARRALVIVALGLVSLIAGWWAVSSADGGEPRHVEVIDLGPSAGTPAGPSPTVPPAETGPPVVPPTVPLPSTPDDDEEDDDGDDDDRDDDGGDDASDEDDDDDDG